MSLSHRQVLSLSAAGFHRMAYTEWGNPDNEQVLICVHGLTRTGRDFDDLAQDLESSYRIACPDVVGRGQSDWLPEPELYQFTQYLTDMAVLLARMNAPAVDWVGTSMGGIIGMLLAAQPRSPIRRLVLNDIGPFIPRRALQSIGNYLGQAPDFPSLEAAADYLSQIHAGFGALTRDQWMHLAVTSTRELDDGGYRLAYDPAIARSSSTEPQDVSLWEYWDRVRCPVLVVRGANSDLLLEETLAEMKTRGPSVVDSVEFEDVGHAPALMNARQIATVRDWLLQTA